MPHNKHIIPPKPTDAGTAVAVADLTRRVSKLETHYGAVGSGATITGPFIETEDTPNKVWIQGTEAGTPGLYGTDSGGNVVISLVPGVGLNIESYITTSVSLATPEINAVTWVDGSFITAEIIGLHIIPPTASMGVISCRAFSPNGLYMGRIFAEADDTNGAIVKCAVADGTYLTILSDNSRNGVWAGSVSANNFVTTSDVINKEHIGDLPDDVLAKLHSLKPVSFRFKDYPEYTNYGFIAQDVKEALPTVVRTYPHFLKGEEVREELGVSLPSLVALAIAVIQQQEQRIKDLEGQWKGQKGQ